MEVSVGERKQWLSGIIMVVLVSFVAAVRPLSHGQTRPPPGTEKLTALFPHVAFDDELTEFYDGENVWPVDNGYAVNLVLDKLSGEEK
ncbi:hypothetical protein KSP40_PGU000567 [Platanthera guangdongensis]|uniref:Uncharacterized protein n=1 Tax=Platanthera guangdongensis TaxID=2320717 RepID=A0ABR2M1I8_9ASPA